jgi:hypothetical protein
MTPGGRILSVVTAVVLLAPATAFAQTQERIGPYALDFRGIFARHKQEPSVATDLSVTAANLPTRSLGLTVGAHVYPFHAGLITFGFGGHLLNGRGSRTLEAVTPSGSTGTTTTTANPGPTVIRHFRVLTPDVSLNFGHRSGWSYISGGLGRSTLFVERKDQPVSDPPGRKTIHYGAGARWFTNHHLAVSLDVRWYAVAPQTASATGGVAQPRTTLLVLSGGIALK